MKVDVFHSGIELPKTVYIVGTGPNGIPHYNEIPSDAYVVVLNKAITIPKTTDVHWHPSMWMQFANGYFHYECPWFMEALDHDPTPRLFGTYPRNHLGIGDTCPCNYVFEYFPSYNAADNIKYGWPDVPPGLVHGVLRTGGTIAGAALQYAAWFGAEMVWLCGIDMQGQKHYDGSMYYRGMDAPAPGKDGKWLDLPVLNRIILDCGSRMEIRSLSPTALKVGGRCE